MKILLAGYYGFGNLGDELLADTVKKLLGSKYKVIILYKRLDFWRQITKNDCLMFPGGSLFQDVTGWGLSPIYYAFLGFWAKLLGKKVFLVAQGLGPLKRFYNKLLVKVLFKNADFVSVRDKDSAEFLNNLGIKNYVLDTDLLFCRSFRPLTKRSNKIAVNLRPFKKFRPEQGRELLRDFPIEYTPLQNGVDLGQPLTTQKVFNVIGSAKLAVGMRLHFLLLAVLHNVPALGIAYDPKVKSFCQKLGLPFVDLEHLPDLPELINRELISPTVTRRELKQLVKAERQTAALGLKHLKEALNA